MGKNGSQNHLQAVFNTNASNIKVMWWLVSFNNELVRKGHENVPEYCDEEEELAQGSQYQETIVYF